MGVLRFVLAMAVVIAHAGPVLGFSIADGRFAVQMFYMVSGFYMALVWNERYAKADSSIRIFYLSRLLRLYPQYVMVLGLSILISAYAWVTQDRHPLAVAQHFPLNTISSLVVYGVQVVLLGQESLLFLAWEADGGLRFTSNFAAAGQPPLHYYMFVPQAWSLSLELMFYMLVPFLLSRVRFMMVVVALSLTVRAIAWRYGYSHDPWTYRFFPFEIAVFLMGALSFRAWECVPSRMRRRFLSPASFVLASLLLGGCVCMFGQFRIAFGEASYWWSYLAAFITLPIVFEATRNSAADRAIGDLSYPIYISHLLVIWALVLVLNVPLNGVVYLAIPLTIAFSLSLNRIQVRVDAFRHSLVRRGSAGDNS